MFQILRFNMKSHSTTTGKSKMAKIDFAAPSVSRVFNSPIILDWNNCRQIVPEIMPIKMKNESGNELLNYRFPSYTITFKNYQVHDFLKPQLLLQAA